MARILGDRLAVLVAPVFVGSLLRVAGVHHKSRGISAGDDKAALIDLPGIFGIAEALRGGPITSKVCESESGSASGGLGINLRLQNLKAPRLRHRCLRPFTIQSILLPAVPDHLLPTNLITFFPAASGVQQGEMEELHRRPT